MLCAVEVELHELHLVSRAWNIAAAADVVFVIHTMLVDHGDGVLQRFCALIEAKISRVCVGTFCHLSMQSSHFTSLAR